jgi:DNA transformation protein and related proteins
VAVSTDQIAHVHDLFEAVGGISTRKMMGGLAIYSNGIIFGLLHSSGQLYLKGANGFGEQLEMLGATRWSYKKNNTSKAVQMPYWTLPDSAADDPSEATALALAALQHL